MNNTKKLAPPNSKNNRVFGLLKNGSNDTLIVFIPGLGDGPFSIPSLNVLDEKFNLLGYSVLQAHLSSAFYGSGLYGISHSALEVFLLVDCIKYKNLILIGHSTGSQVALEFAKSYGSKITSLTLILLGAVSDRHGITATHLVEKARELVEKGLGDNILPEMYADLPMTANRLNDLTLKGGEDDYFSPDLDLEYLMEKYKDLESYRILFVYGDDDEYMSSIEEYRALINKLNTFFITHAHFAVIKGNHNFDGYSLDLYNEILRFLKNEK